MSEPVFADLGRPRSRVKRKQFTVTLSSESEEHLEALAEEYGLTRSAIIDRLLEHDKQQRGCFERSGD